MGSERDYLRLLESEAKALAPAANTVLKSVTKASPLLSGSRIKNKHWKSQDSGDEEDAYEWWVERDKNFVVRRVRISVRASRMAFLLQGRFSAQYVVAADYQKKPHFGDMSAYTNTYPVEVDNPTVEELTDAVVAVMKIAF